MPDYDAQFGPDVESIRARRALAKALMERGRSTSGDTQMVSGIAIRNSPFAGLANMLDAYRGGKMNRQVDDESKALVAALRTQEGQEKIEAQNSQERLIESTPEYDLYGTGGDKPLTTKKTYRERPQETPTSVREYEYAKGNGYKSSYAQWVKDQKTAVQQFKTDNPTPVKDKSIPVGAMKEMKQSREALRAAQRMEQTFEETRGLIHGGQPTAEGGAAPALEIGPVDRFGGWIADRSGYGTANSKGLQELKRVRNKLRNDYLLLAKGVQTEGDAQRAMDAMMPDTNDVPTLLEQLDKVQAASANLQSLHAESLKSFEQEYGAQPTDVAPLKPSGAAPAPAAGPAPAGVDPALWQHMTPEDKALWK